MARLSWFHRPENFQNDQNVFVKGSPKFSTGICTQKMCLFARTYRVPGVLPVLTFIREMLFTDRKRAALMAVRARVR